MFLRVFHHFSPKKPNFDSPNTLIRPQSFFIGLCTLKGFQKHIKLEIKYHFNRIHQFNHFHKNPQQQFNSHHKSMIMTPHSMNHQQQHLITTTTTINHEFINNPSTTTYLTNFEQNTNMYVYTS